MTNVVEEDKAKTQPPEAFQNGDNSLSGSDSDNNAAKTTSSSCSSVASSSSSGTASKLAIRMADKVNLTSYPAEKRFKFEPNEDYLDQLLAMGISINGAKKVTEHFKKFEKQQCKNLLIIYSGIVLYWKSKRDLSHQLDL